MFVGHFGLGLAGKRVVPEIALGTLFLSVQFADALWPLLVLLGVEHVRVAPGILRLQNLDFYDYPFSHSLAALVAWGILFGAVYWLIRRRLAAAVVLGIGVVSHWVLDVLVHRPDVPVLPRGPYLGLGLWNSVPATLALEGGLYAGGAILYARATRPRDRAGSAALSVLLVLLAGLWLAAIFGPPPPSARVVAVSALAGWLIVPWGYWIDAHRALR